MVGPELIEVLRLHMLLGMAQTTAPVNKADSVLGFGIGGKRGKCEVCVCSDIRHGSSGMIAICNLKLSALKLPT